MKLPNTILSYWFSAFWRGQISSKQNTPTCHNSVIFTGRWIWV